MSLREAEALANLLLFVPFGALLALAVPRLLLVALLGFTCATSIGIELTQYVFLPDRVPSLLDVIMNIGRRRRRAGAGWGRATARAPLAAARTGRPASPPPAPGSSCARPRRSRR